MAAPGVLGQIKMVKSSDQKKKGETTSSGGEMW